MYIIEANLPQINEPLCIGLLASKNGTDTRGIVEAIEQGRIDAQPVLVISNNSDASVLNFAKEHNIPTQHISRVSEGSEEAVDKKIRDEFLAAGVNLIILTGYMRPIGPETLAAFEGRILNVHPALDMERFAGRGMYGHRVHQAVLDAGERVTGATIHIVDSEYDHGPIVAQQEVPIMQDDTAETLAKRVQAQEIPLYISVLQKITSRRFTEVND